MNESELNELIKRAKEHGWFKDYIYKDCVSAADFFCARFLGVQTSAYIAGAGMKDVTLIDNDPIKMEDMKRIYPDEWTFIVDDAFKIVREFNDKNIKFDLVSCDPWSNTVDDVLTKDFTLFWNITNKYFICVSCLNNFYKSNNIEPTKESIESYIKKVHNIEVVVDYIIKVGDCEGGSYYIIIKKGE